MSESTSTSLTPRMTLGETWVPRVSFSALSIVLWWVTLWTPYRNGPAIRSDGAGYHAWVYALRFGDLSFCDFSGILEANAAISSGSDAAGICQNKYPPGVGLFQLLFVFPWLSRTDSAGFPQESHNAILLLGALMILAITLLSFRALREMGVASIPATFAVAALLLGTGLFHYGTYDASFSHVYSAFGVAFLIWLVARHRSERWTVPLSIVFGIVCLWLYLVRQTNGLLTLVILLVALLISGRFVLQRSLIAAWGTGTAVGLGIQIAINFYSTHTFTVSSYGTESFGAPWLHILDVLVSYDRGLVVYYPIVALVIIASILIWRSKVALIFAGLVVAYTVLYASWHSWALGAGFGHRGFVELAPLGMFVLGITVSRASPRVRLILYGVGLLCLYVTVRLMIGYWLADLPQAGTDQDTFWSNLIPWLSLSSSSS